MSGRSTHGPLTGQHALVVSPFLPVPTDAGQRKRVMQMHQVLRAAGCKVTMLHLAIEHSLAWAHHEGIHDAARLLVDEMITIYPGPMVGQPPLEGGAHRLDEWWDPLLGAHIERLFKHRWFDLVVVNNVWLSKVFDYAPPGAVRILETHDVFSDRIQALRQIGFAPDFFVCERPDESFGWNRADVVVAIADKEAAVMAPHLTSASVVTLPYAEAMHLPTGAPYQHPDKVRFGFYGSAHPFNVHGLKALIAALEEDAARWSPVELVIAGDVGRALTANERSMVVDLGYVDSPDDFYCAVDVVVSPLDHGSGLKIKVVEAICRGVPLIVTEHSAIGSGIDRRLVVRDAAALAKAMAHVAVRRPSLDDIRDAVRVSQQSLASTVEAGTSRLLGLVNAKRRRTVIRHGGFSAPRTSPRFWAAIAMTRELANLGPVSLDLVSAAEPSWLRLMPPRVQIVCDSECDADRGASIARSRAPVPRPLLENSTETIVVVSDDPGYRVRGSSLHIHDARQSGHAAPPHAEVVLGADGLCHSTATGKQLRGWPWWSDSMHWDPVLPRQSSDRDDRVVFVADGLHRCAAVGTLAAWAALISTSPVEVHDSADVFADDGAIAALRARPPRLVLRLRCDAVEGPVEQWCSLNGIPCVTVASAWQVQLVLANRPAPAGRKPPRWQDALACLFQAA